MPDQKTTLTIVVNGTPTEVEVNDNSPLKVVVSKALEQTHNVGQPPENWELKDAQGNVFTDLEKKVGDYHFPPKTTLFLSLKAGVGG
jgi:hypothetical protein